MRERIIGYVRESTREQALNGFNLIDQQKKIKGYCELFSLGDDITMLIEAGASAKTLKRQEMDKLLEMIKNDEVKTVIVYCLDRLTRRVKDLSTLLELFQKHNVELISINEKIDTTNATGRFIVYILASVAQWEQDTIGERAIRGVDESAYQGNYSKGGKPPFGYIRLDKKLIIDEEKVLIVKDIFHKIAECGYSVLGLVQYLKANYKDVIYWHQMAIWRIVRNNIYYGCFSFRNYQIENHSPAIITKELFDEAQFAISKRRRIHNRKYLFKNLVKCHKCNTLLTQSSTNKKYKTYLYYYCECCNSRINEDIIFDLVKDVIDMENKKKINKIKKVLNQKKITNNEKDLVYIDDAHVNGYIGDDEYKERVNKHKEKLALIENTIEESDMKIIKFEKMNFTDRRKKLLEIVKYINIDMIEKNLINIEYRHK